MEGYLVSLLIAAGLAFIPANIANKKGHSFGLWWFYGWMLFIVAIIHVNFIPDKNAPVTVEKSAVVSADELKKYKELLDQGAISEEEFAKLKSNCLSKM